MRPPEHWHLRRRRRLDPRWWFLALAVVVVAGGALLLQFRSSGGDSSGNDTESLVASSTCAVGVDCAPEATPECIEGADCAPEATPECIEGAGCATSATPECIEGVDCVASATAECAVGADCVPSDAGPSLGSDIALPGDEFIVASDTAPPEITGEAAAVIEQSCGALLYGRNAHERLAPASLTKIVTALVAEERADPSEMVDVQVDSALLNASTGSSVMGLKPGQQLSMRDLLYGLLLPSGNDAAIAIAQHVGGSEAAFVSLMNREAQELGLPNTHFVNPHGLDEAGLYTSAFDIAILGRELLARPALAKIVGTPTYQPAWDGPPIWNANRLLYDYPESLGVKTGYTVDAGQTMVAAAERDGRTVIVSVMGAWDRYADAVGLLEWAFASTTSPCYE